MRRSLSASAQDPFLAKKKILNYFVILDSISSATEGVEEKDGGKAGAGLAPLLDAARRGPAVLLLANTDKLGLKVRGSGTLNDRADIVFEVRDATDLKIEAKMQAWWDALPDGAEHAWGERTKRRRRRDSYRLAMMASKFRLGEEPNPLAYEIRHDTEPWSVAEVTSEIEQQLDDAKRQVADAEQAKVDGAVAALREKLPLPKNPEAVEVLTSFGLSRSAARRLIDDRAGRDWILAGAGTIQSRIDRPVRCQYLRWRRGWGHLERPEPAPTSWRSDPRIPEQLRDELLRWEPQLKAMGWSEERIWRRSFWPHSAEHPMTVAKPRTPWCIAKSGEPSKR